MRRLIFIMIIFLSGCNTKFSGDVIEKAVAFCKPHGGVVYLQEGKPYNYVKCADMSMVYLKDIK